MATETTRTGIAAASALLIGGLLSAGLRPASAVDYSANPQVACVYTGAALNKIRENSGLAVSRRTAGIFWTHNDSGDSSRIYAVDTAGNLRATVNVKNAANKDWEDIASFDHNGRHWLLVADTGNNELTSEKQELYIIGEPALTATEVNPTAVLTFSYPGKNRDVEAVAVDPVKGKILLIEKTKDGSAKVFQLPLKFSTQTLTAEEIGVIYTPSNSNGQVTAMDISPDGSRAIVLTYGDAYEFTRGSTESWKDAFARPGKKVYMPWRPQGESICYGTDGKTLYLTTEVGSSDTSVPLWVVRPLN
jgi:hypothetical protein